MKRLSVLGYASGSPLSHIVMRRIAAEHDLIAIVHPARGFRAWLKRLLGRKVWPDVAAPMISRDAARRYAPDLIVVASYPTLLRSAALERASIGALNVHTSLLPRHRGIDPIFSTYWHDDAEAGVTLHWMDAGIDSGDIAAQTAILLERGTPSRDLYHKLAAHAADLASTILVAIAAGEMPRRSQSESDVISMSAADIARAKLPFAQWPAERVWHVLKGLGDQRATLIVDERGRIVPHKQATGWRAAAVDRPGRIDASATGYDLHCSDGIVTVERRD